MNTYDIVGIAGAGLVIFGLYRTYSGAWNDKSLWYELDHAVGSLLLIVYLAHARAYIGIVINVAYLIVAFLGLRSYAERHRKKPRR